MFPESIVRAPASHVAARGVQANLLWYAVPRLLSRGSAFFLLPLYTRVLSPTEMGTAMVALALGGILGLVIAPGIEAAYFRWAYHPDGSAEVRARRAGTITVIHLALLAASIVLLASLGGPIAKWLMPGIPAWPFYYLTLATAALSSLTAPVQTAWKVERRADKLALVEVAHAVIAVVTILTCLLVVGLGAVSLLLGDLVARIVLLPWYLKRPLHALARGWDWALAGEIRPVALVGLPLALSAWALSSLDRIFLNAFRGTADAGFYSAAYQIAAAVMLISIILDKEWQPLTFSLMGKRPRKGSGVLQVLWTQSLCVFLAFGSLIAVWSWEIVRWGFGERYLASAALVPLVVTMAVLRVPRIFLLHVSLASGLTRDLAIESGLAVAVFIAANLLLIPRFGGTGAAWAGVLAYAAGCLFLFSREWNAFRVDHRVLTWTGALGSSVIIGCFAGGTVAAHLAGVVIGALFIHQAWTYWHFLGAIQMHEAGS